MRQIIKGYKKDSQYYACYNDKWVNVFFLPVPGYTTMNALHEQHASGTDN